MPGADSVIKRALKAVAPRRVEDRRFLAVAAAATAALDQLNHGIALIDQHCQVSFANKLARSICRECDGVALRGYQLRGTSATGSARLSAALTSVIRDGEASVIRIERSMGRRPLSMQIAPLQVGRTQSPVDAALVLIHDCHRYAVPPKERLCEAYGLTAAEAGVARLLLRGAGLPEISMELRVSLETVRTHLRRVLGKTGVHRQSDLILLLMREVGHGLYDEHGQPRSALDQASSTHTLFG